MKQLVSITIIMCMALSLVAQSNLDKSLAEISDDIASKLSIKGAKKIVVLYVNDVNKSNTVAGKYIADVISVDIVNNAANFQVFDRENLNSIAEAKKLIAEGYIDVDMAKALGKRLSVDAIIIGTYTVLSNSLKLTIKALDSSSGFVMAASMKDLVIDADAGALLGINVSTSGNASNTSLGNRGFNVPLNSGENYNNPETVDTECETKMIGDYCFENRIAKKIWITILKEGSYSAKIIIEPGQTKCLYNIKKGNYKYFLYDRGPYNGEFSKGEILIEKCKSKTLTIK